MKLPPETSPDVRHDPATRRRAELSGGTSGDAIHRLVRRVVERATVGERAATLVDMGCGGGGLARALDGLFDRYVGCDILRYDGFPADARSSFVEANLDRPPYGLPDGGACVTCAVETIEHLENPRAFVRELKRITRPGGLIVVTTPNQLSLLSKVTLLVKNQFNAFQDGCYPAHITALVEMDLVRIATECGLDEIRIHYTDHGRVPFTARHWPPTFRGRWFSDNVLLRARRRVEGRT